MIVPIARTVWVPATSIQRIVRSGDDYVVHYHHTRDVDVVRGADALELQRFLRKFASAGDPEAAGVGNHRRQR